MSVQAMPMPDAQSEAHASRVPMIAIAIAIAQIIMSFNVASLPVSMGAW
jgi:hypothetical protein